MPENAVPIVIGGEVIGVPPMNFASLKRAWPAIRALPDMRDAVEQAGAVVEIVAAALAAVRPELTIAEIEQRLSGGEVLALVGAAPPTSPMPAICCRVSRRWSPTPAR
jgi:hypothetical protein